MEGLAAIPAGSVHAVVTSPPYWGLRDYGFEGQIGSEKTPQEFVARMVEVFRGVKRCLRDDGVLFVNLGDSYAAGNGQRKSTDIAGFKQRSNTASVQTPSRHVEGIAAGNAIGIPWRVAFALQDDGWIIRSEIIWSKPSPMPESVSGWRWVRCRNLIGHSGRTKQTIEGQFSNSPAHRGNKGGSGSTQQAVFESCLGCDKCEATGGFVLRAGSWRPTKSHEQIFMFAKSSKYFADGDGSKEQATGMPSGNKQKRWGNNDTTDRKNGSGTVERHGNIPHAGSETRNMRSVWKISSESYKEAHFATYPTELVRRCLIAATSRGGCCSECGNQWAPVIETERRATRPGTNSKVNRVSVHDESPYQSHSGNICGNRDPKRHTTVTKVLNYLPTCKCGAESVRPTVLDPFSGSGTTGQVAINLGCDYIGIEANPSYADLQVKRLGTPWVPVADRKKPRGKLRRRVVAQRELF